MKSTKLFLSFLIRIIPSRLLLILLLMVGGYYTINNAFGKTVTSNGTGGGDWTVAGTWDLGVPLSTDDVVIADGDIVNVNVNETCNKLTIQADALGIDLTSFTINSGKSLTVNADIDFAMLNGASITFSMSGPVTSQLLFKGNFTNYTLGGTVAFYLDPTSRVRYNSVSPASQTIIAINYGLLLSSSTGPRVLASS